MACPHGNGVMTETISTMTQTQAVDHEAEIAGRLAQLSLEQKIQLMTGADIWALHAIPEIGLRRLVTSDGPAGVRGETWDERSPSANVPSPTALAASWDPVRVERMGRLLASEARRKGVDVLLAPTVNLHRTPYGGRHFECFSEDPELTAMIGTAYVQGLQAEGVAATVKHFVANDSETDRFSVDALVDERVLRELYLAPFERIVAAGAWAMMAAYNRVNGTTMTENPLQRNVLKREWAFDGVIMSDWYATRSVAAAGEDMLDLAMPGPESPWTEWLLDAVQSGQISESAVDGHVLRILRLAARVGALDGLAAATPPAQRWSDQELSSELRAAAAAGMVLIKNDGLLPLDMSSLKQVALIGPNAATARTLGGGSATVFPALRRFSARWAARCARCRDHDRASRRGAEQRARRCRLERSAAPARWQRPRRRGDLLRCQRSRTRSAAAAGRQHDVVGAGTGRRQRQRN